MADLSSLQGVALGGCLAIVGGAIGQFFAHIFTVRRERDLRKHQSDLASSDRTRANIERIASAAIRASFCVSDTVKKMVSGDGDIMKHQVEESLFEMIVIQELHFPDLESTVSNFRDALQPIIESITAYVLAGENSEHKKIALEMLNRCDGATMANARSILVRKCRELMDQQA